MTKVSWKYEDGARWGRAEVALPGGQTAELIVEMENDGSVITEPKFFDIEASEGQIVLRVGERVHSIVGYTAEGWTNDERCEIYAIR